MAQKQAENIANKSFIKCSSFHLSSFIISEKSKNKQYFTSYLVNLVQYLEIIRG